MEPLQWSVAEPCERPEVDALVERALAVDGLLVLPSCECREQARECETQAKAAGLENIHGWRHACARRRYAYLTGLKRPMASGPSRFTRRRAFGCSRAIRSGRAATDERGRLL